MGMLKRRLSWFAVLALAGCATGVESKPDVAAPAQENFVIVASYLDSDHAAGEGVTALMAQLAVRGGGAVCSLGCTVSVPASRAAEVRRILHAAVDKEHLAIDVYDTEPVTATAVVREVPPSH
jgi:hypothetical protein